MTWYAEAISLFSRFKLSIRSSWDWIFFDVVKYQHLKTRRSLVMREGRNLTSAAKSFSSFVLFSRGAKGLAPSSDFWSEWVY